MLTVIIKGTNSCNLACSYCSLGEKTSFHFSNAGTLKKIFTYSCEYALDRRETELNFILHGGEPTLIKAETYEEAIEYVMKKYNQLNILISMQSNGYSITDDWIAFIKKYDVCMGISIDGSEVIHDSERRTVTGEPTFQIVSDNIDKMMDAGIKVSCLMVLTKNAIGKSFEYLRFYEKRQIHLKINPLLNYGKVDEHPELSLGQGEYADYLIRMYEYIIKHDINVIPSPIDHLLRAVLEKHRVYECSFNNECNKHFLCIDYREDIYPCGKFSDMEDFKIGNINDTAAGSIYPWLMSELFKRRNDKKPEKCMRCKYIKLCNCGCSAGAVIDGNIENVPFLCEDYKMLFEYFHKEGLVLLKNELLRQKKLLEAR